MSSLLLGTIITVASIVLAIAGLLVVRRTVPLEILADNHDVATAMLGILGTLYAIVLGLVVVEAITRHSTAEMQESIEASNLVAMSELVRGTDRDFRERLIQAELDYCDAVVHGEWPLLAKGEAPDKDAVRAFSRTWGLVARYQPKTTAEQDLHSSLLSSMIQVSDARRYRLIASRHGLPKLLWLILIVGGVCTIAFTYCFAARNIKLQVVMTSIITLVFSLNMSLVLFLGKPYYGDLQVEPTSFLRCLAILKKKPVLQHQENQQNREGTEPDDDLPPANDSAK